MKYTGIIFQGWGVNAILEGRKTQTRRIIKFPRSGKYQTRESDWDIFPGGASNNPHIYMTVRTGIVFNVPSGKPSQALQDHLLHCPYGQVGDRLYIKQAYDPEVVYYKPIDGLGGNYAAGTDGRIYRMDGTKPYPLRATAMSKGYLGVSLSHHGTTTMSVHHLVCQAFYGSAPDGREQVRHLDGDQLNNIPANLDCGSQEDNWLDRKYHGGGMGEAHHNAKLTVAQVLEIGRSKRSQRQLASQYRVSQATIQSVKSGETWTRPHRQHCRNFPAWNGWRSPLFMPRWASRITLEITGVKVEYLNAITLAGIQAEGIYDDRATYNAPKQMQKFIGLWDSINAKRGYGWDANPWVWALTFKVIGDRNADHSN